MSVTLKVKGRIPTPHQQVRVIDQEAKAAVERAGQHAKTTMAHIGGRVGANALVSVRDTRGGTTASVRPSSKNRKLFRWLDEGTGLHVPHHRAIRGGRRASGARGPLKMPWGYRAKAKGQRPKRILERTIRAAEPQALRHLQDGAVRAAERLQRMMTRG